MSPFVIYSECSYVDGPIYERFSQSDSIFNSPRDREATPIHAVRRWKVAYRNPSRFNLAGWLAALNNMCIHDRKKADHFKMLEKAISFSLHSNSPFSVRGAGYYTIRLMKQYFLSN